MNYIGKGRDTAHIELFIKRNRANSVSYAVTMKISFIGCGNMAQPIICSVAEKNLVSPADIGVYDIITDKLEEFCSKNGFTALKNEEEAVSGCEVLFLCIKPQGFPELLSKIAPAVNNNKPLVVSIAAGKTITSIASYFDNGIRIGRIFPNLNANVRLAVSAYTVNTYSSDKDREIINSVCSSYGDAVYLEEDRFSVFGVLSGCAPAYTFMFIDALAQAAKDNGIDPDLADSVAAQVVLGSAALLKSGFSDAENLIERVCSKGGTTIEGVTSLRNDDVNNMVKKAFNASLARDAQLNG